MPYLEAVILETLRMSSLAPFGLIHRLLENIEFEGHTFYKDMILIANIYHVHNDKEFWEDPEVFRPERFQEGGEEQRKRLKEHVVAFQLGRRMCPGEFLAKDVIFLCVAKLFQKYNFYPDDNVKVNEYLKPIAGFLLKPQTLGVVIKPRNYN